MNFSQKELISAKAVELGADMAAETQKFLPMVAEAQRPKAHSRWHISRGHWLAIMGITVIPVSIFRLKALLTEPGSSLQQVLEPIALLSSLTFSFTITAVLYLGNLWFIRYLDDRLPWQGHALQRLPVQVAWAILYSGGTMAVFYTGFASIAPGAGRSAEAIFRNVYIAIVITLIVMAILEGLSFFRHWRQSRLEAEQLQRANLQARFEVLCNQVRPHFLFNSLNVLSSLVHKDPELAEDFIEQLSEVYRYVLDTANQNLVTVEQDVQALEAYFFLQQTRYGADSLQFRNELNGDARQAWIPPLTLQMLAENAVKHNVASEQKPLKLTLSCAAGHFLRLTNNKQKRTDQHPSTGVGLLNLKSRFGLVNERLPVFQEEPDTFNAYIPLIN